MDLIDTWISTKYYSHSLSLNPLYNALIVCSHSFNLSINNNIHLLNLISFRMQSNSFQNTLMQSNRLFMLPTKSIWYMGHVRFISIPLGSCVPIENKSKRKKKRLSIECDTPALLFAIASTDKHKKKPETNDSILFQLNVKYTHSITACTYCLALDCQNGRSIRFGHREKSAHSDKSIERQTKHIKQWQAKNNAYEHNWFRFHL